jgi:hypothetical protein
VRDNRPLVYGGGAQGIMGVVSGTVLKDGGVVTGIMPYAIHIGGGEREKLEVVSNGVGCPRVVGRDTKASSSHVLSLTVLMTSPRVDGNRTS